MKMIITIKTGKENSTKKEIDDTVDMVLDMGSYLNKKHYTSRGGVKTKDL